MDRFGHTILDVLPHPPLQRMDRFGHTILDVLPHPPLHTMWWLTGYRDLFWCSFDTNSGFLYTFHSKIHQLLQTLKTMFFKIQRQKSLIAHF